MMIYMLKKLWIKVYKNFKDKKILVNTVTAEFYKIFVKFNASKHD